MRDRICRDKVILKLGFDRGLNLGYLAHGLFDLGAGGDVAQRYPCARTGRFAEICAPNAPARTTLSTLSTAMSSISRRAPA